MQPAHAPSKKIALVGSPGDGWWLWAPLPLLAGIAALISLFSPRFGADIALKSLLLINFMHLGATWTRLYGDARKAHPIAAYPLPIVLLIFSLVLMGRGYETLLFFLVFLANIPHIGLQNYGFIQIASQQQGCASPIDRRLDKAYQVIIPLFLALWFVTQPDANLFNSQNLDLQFIRGYILLPSAVLASLVAVLTFARILFLKVSGNAIPQERWILHLLYGPGMFLCFLGLPPELAPLPIAGTHYIQYLVVVRRYHHRASAQQKSANIWSRIHPLAYLMLLALLAPGIPVLVDTALEPILGQMIPAIGAAASLHHFLSDALIWRLRDKKNRARMLA